jgi:hypothetical protein
MSRDPAFLFYPADASEDTQFMNRLERGAYFDLVKCQRIFGGFTVVQLRKVLGNDFDTVKDALLAVLKLEGEMYFIEWVKNSIERRAQYSQKQRNRVTTRWNKEREKKLKKAQKNGNTVGNTTVLPQNEIANANANEDVNKIEYEVGVKLLETEYKKLCTDFGKEKTDKAIKFLSDYKQEKNYQTKDCNLTLRRWVFDAINKQQSNGTKIEHGIGGPVKPQPFGKF